MRSPHLSTPTLFVNPTIACLGALLLAALCATTLTATAPVQEGSDSVQSFLAQRPSPHSYRATRRLEATGRGVHGWMDARTDFTPGVGLSYEVTAEGGSGYIRSRVLRRLLEEERLLIARGDSGRAAISSANYTFTDDGMDEHGLSRVRLLPLRKERPLINGRMFLSPGDGDLVRVEGQLAKNPSFWVSQVHIVRSYQRINGALVPVLLESTAQLRLLGQSTLRMTYSYLQIDLQPAADQQADPND